MRSEAHLSVTPVALNNLGASLLVKRNNEHALRILTSALNLTKSNLTRIRKGRIGTSFPNISACGKREEPSASSPPSSHIASSRLRHSTFAESIIIIEEEMTRNRPQTQTESVANSEISSLFMFTEPLLVDENLECGLDHDSLMKLIVVIIFNMALANHLFAQSLDIPMRRERLLKRALALYKLSCRIQVHQKVKIDEMYVLAHINNLGHVHETLGNIRMSKKCFRRLLRDLLLYMHWPREDHSHIHENHEVLQGFQKNTQQFILHDPQVAVAA